MKRLAGVIPKERPCAAAASTNSVEAIKAEGSPRLSRFMMSCKLHEVHEPQSASPSITASHSTLIFCVSSKGASLANVGFA
jgi:hypothetical protein